MTLRGTGTALLAVFSIYILDQVTKFLVIRNIPLYGDIPIIPGFFSLTFVTNRGAAFGMFQNGHYFFLILSLVVLIGIVVFALRGAFQTRLTRWAGILLAAGIMGNLTDRIIHGYVIDFLHFYVGEWAWPSFNVADSSICIAAGLFILSSFLDVGREKVRA